MRSRIPKVLHPLAGRSMLDHVLDSLATAGVSRPVVVTGHGAEAVEDRGVQQVPDAGPEVTPADSRVGARAHAPELYICADPSNT